MSRQIQIRRGTVAENDAFTGAIGEVTMDTTNKTLRVHDGETAGGIKLAKQSEIPEIPTIPDIKFIPDYDNLTQNTNNAPSEYTATQDCWVCAKGSPLAYDLYKDNTSILVEFLYSNYYSSSWVFLPKGYKIVRIITSQYNNLVIVPVK